MSKQLIKRLLFLISFLAVLPSAFCQQRVIKGKVTDEKNTPLQGASVSVKGKEIAVRTDAAGNFKISVPEHSKVLVASYAEYQSQELSVTGKTSVIFTLQPNSRNLDSVVVIGYGTQKRKDVTDAISSVKGDAIKDLPVQNVADALQGRIAGVEVIKSSGEPGASSQITIRGVSSLNQTQPLYIIDGVQQSGDNINPHDLMILPPLMF